MFLTVSPHISMLISRTTDGPSSGSGSASSSTSGSGDSSGHRSIGINVIVPIVLIIVVAISSALFILFCRRVLRRSRLPAAKQEVTHEHTRPDWWDVSLERPETGLPSLQQIQPVALRYSGKEAADLSYSWKSKPRMEPEHSQEDALEAMVHIAMPARSYQEKQSIPEGLSFARNILIFTLAIRRDLAGKELLAWNIFYHLFLDTASLELLLSQCHHLSDSSASFETWHASPFSKYIKIGTALTLHELHRHWRWYASTAMFSDTHKARLKSKFQAYLKKHKDYYRGFVSTAAARACGPLWADAAIITNEIYHRYWERGTLLTQDQDIVSATHVNPLFAYSNHSEQFAMNDFTSPLATFALAGLFTPIAPSKDTEWRDPGPRACFEAACLQFTAWLGCFREAVLAGDKMVLRFVYSDPLAFGLTAQEYLQSGNTSAACRVAPWRAPFLVLDGDGCSPSSFPQAPASFDVIDTCDTSDRYGLLNVLLAASPLLRSHPWAVMYTETVEAHGDDPSKDFWIQLCGDLGAMTMLFDLAPTSFLSGFRSEGNTHELVLPQLMPNLMWHLERLTWRRPSRLGTSPSDQCLAFDKNQLRDFFYGVYVKMFQREAFSYTTDTVGSDKERDRSHYNRRTLGLLLRQIAGRVSVDWEAFVAEFVLRMDEPDLMIGKISIHDVCSQLYNLGLVSDQMFNPGQGFSMIFTPRECGRLRSWGTIPHTVYIAVMVPRKTFRLLDKRDTPRDPPIAAGVGSTTGNESYHFVFVETCFGTLSVEGADEHARGTIREDPAGRRGDAPVVLTFPVPTHILARPFPMEMHVRLLVLKTPHTDYFYEKYGNMGRFFDVSTTDPSVHILAHKPTTRRDAHIEERINPPIKWAKKAADSVQIIMNTANTQIQTMTARASIRESLARAALSDKATPVTFEQVDFRIIRLSIGSQCHQDVVFPYPLHGVKARIRISRKDSWIEVIVPPQMFQTSNRFPIIAAQGAAAVWNMHRVWFGKMPTVSLVAHDLTKWVVRHANSALTNKEKQAHDKLTEADPLTLVKHTISSMFKNYIGTKDAASKSVFKVSLPDGSLEFIIFVASLRLDLTGHTVVFDAHVFTGDIKLTAPHNTALAKLRGVTSQLVISDREAALWKHLLRALSERCRDWKHSADCALAAHTLPQSAAPLLDWAPFAPHLARVALSPLFGVSYLEPTGKIGGPDLVGILEEHGLTPTMLRMLTSEGGRCDQDHHDTVCRTCLHWLPPGSRRLCMGCEDAVYCGIACQTYDWQQHRPGCKAAQRRR
ncbi:hypothetical protein PHLGIDRAFT_118669 [Phlebiopsis gigantea 11061_1 CR5-6]|uniref:MYND-type domain-containing protein n=1 Tax=Phlebiopsis gigantea (strain 11061_1 CR5-6) TaxID=745531 RepID=A0A0C3S7L0_PHLG1|nr:hypothetical protein PHLGIDRAFT_118669 [Phlebiopsis gigantea 11061_1 CR5-6]